MDARQFDALTRALSGPGPRRRLLGLLATVPLLGGLLAVLSPEETDAKDRRRRRKGRHKKRKDKSQGKRKGKRGCTPKSRAKACAGQCGEVKNRQTCGKTVDCGSCDCDPPCGKCFTCQGAAGAPGTCVPQAGAPCGEGATCTDGVSQPQGSCDGNGVCQPAAPVSCAPYLHCDGNACAASCANNDDCVADSYCQDGQCVGDGQDGDPCGHDSQCVSGHCVDKICCNEACTGACVACNLAVKGTCSPRESGTLCGAGQTCDAGTVYPQGTCDGSGACQPAAPVSCTPYTQCAGNECATSCMDSNDCDDVCCSGTCQECCTNADCDDPARPICDAGTCTACSATSPCESGEVCCGGSCYAGICCEDATCGEPEAPDCVNHRCVCSSNGDTPCTGGEACCGVGCVDLQTSNTNCGTCGKACGEGQVCQDGVCGVVCGDDFCAADTEICMEGACQACNVTCTGSAEECGETLRDALAGDASSLYVCAGTYQGGFTITRDVTIIGAGEGKNPATNTVLHGSGTQRVLDIPMRVVTLRRLHITRGEAGTGGGGGIRQQSGTLTMEAVTVAENRGRVAGGIMSDGTLNMTRCTVRKNHAPADGGGSYGGGLALYSIYGPSTLTDCHITENTADVYGGGLYVGVNGQTTLAGATLIEANEANLGGGICAGLDALGSLTIGKDCRITGNTAPAASGGGIYRFSPNGSVTLGGDEPALIVTNNCHENCAGSAIAGCTSTSVRCED